MLSPINPNMEKSIILGIDRLERICKKMKSILEGNVGQVVLNLSTLRALIADLDNGLKLLNFLMQQSEELKHTPNINSSVFKELEE